MLQLPVHSYRLRSLPASGARLVNCYAEPLPAGAKTPVLLTRAPGLSTWTTVGDGPIVAMHAALGLLFVVSGSKLYSVTSAGVATERGTIGTPDNVDIDSNGSSVVVVNEPNAYYWDGSTFGQITDTDFTSRGAGDVEFIDNYLLFREPDSGRFFGSDLASATSYDALNFATAEGFPDDLVGLKVDRRQVILLGSETTEIYDNTGRSGFPFERTIGGFMPTGCLNGRTVAANDQTVLWLANDKTVRALAGNTAVRVSTHAVEQFIATATVDEASAFAYSIDGHNFYVLSFPEGAWSYDSTTNEWHERQTYDRDDWVPSCSARAFGLDLLGSSVDNKIGSVSPTTYTEYGTTQRMEWTYQPIYAENRLAFHDRLEIVLETGVGLTSGQGSDPEIMLSYSDDGGITWTSLPNRKLGQIGEYRKRVVWHRLGAARQRVYRCAISDPVKVAVTDTQILVRGGRIGA
jgi:hypothetical protein